MYPRSGALASTAGTGALAETGLPIGWLVMLALMLFVLGATLVRLIPRSDISLPAGGPVADSSTAPGGR